jgi:hypothetical protein
MKINADQFKKLQEVWRTWLRLSGENTDIFKQRRRLFDSTTRYGMASYIDEMPKKHQSSAEEWLNNGILRGETSRKNLTKENITLLGPSLKLDHNTGSYEYAIPSDSFPFNSWDYKAVSAAYPDTKSLNEMYNAYITEVLRKCAARLQSDDIQLSFILSNCTDITPYLPEGMSFDRITMSNLWDYVPLRDLLNMMKPLLNTLNKSAVIVTETQNWARQFLDIHVKIFGMTRSPGSELRKKVLQDTGNRAIAESNGIHGFRDYYSLTEEFTSFLRASLLNSSKYSNLNPKSLLPSVNQLAAELGLKSRDFICRENKVAPFQWTVNPRRVTLLRGTELSIEWSLL